MSTTRTEPAHRRLYRAIRARDRADDIERELLAAAEELDTVELFLDSGDAELARRCIDDAGAAVSRALALHRGEA